VHGPDGGAFTVDAAPSRYHMMRSGAYERLVLARLARSPGGACAARDRADGVRRAGKR
jgi:lycopene beta-cyclase